MPLINYATREINVKIVYCGPGMGGKTTTLQHIYDRTSQASRGKLVTLATEGDRTLFFDFMPLDIGLVKGFRTRLHLYTVPGQVLYEHSRRIILRGADGVVFVADSRPERRDANLEALDDTIRNVEAYAKVFETFPYVLQLNKRDLPDAVPVPEMVELLRRKAEPEPEPVIESVATRGEGVFEVLTAVVKQAFKQIGKSPEKQDEERRAALARRGREIRGELGVEEGAEGAGAGLELEPSVSH